MSLHVPVNDHVTTYHHYSCVSNTGSEIHIITILIVLDTIVKDALY